MNKKLSTGYFLTAKAFELIGVILLIFCYIMYGNILFMLFGWLVNGLDYCVQDSISFWFIGLFWPILILIIAIISIFMSIPLTVQTMLSFVMLGLLALAGAFPIIIIMVHLAGWWINFNKKNLR